MQKPKTLKEFWRRALRQWPVPLFFFILGLLWSVYRDGLHPQLYYDIQSSTSVLELNEELPNLDIKYNDIDIRQQKLSLQIIYVKAINDSPKGIFKNYYDERDPVGLRVSLGRLVKTDVIETSEEHLKKSLAIRAEGLDTILFNDVDLGAHEYFILKLIVLHPNGQIPLIKPVGHIASIKNIKVREEYKDAGLSAEWRQAISGSWFVQTLRLMVYFMGMAFIVLFFGGLMAKGSDFIDDRRLKRNVKRFKESTSLTLDGRDDHIFSNYIWGGYGELKLDEWILQNKETLHEAWKSANIERISQASYPLPKAFQKNYPGTHDQLMLTRIDALVQSGFVQQKSGDLFVDPHMKETLETFLAYLRKHGLSDDPGPVPGQNNKGNTTSVGNAR